MTQTSRTDIRKLVRTPAVADGLERLERDIQSRDSVFCCCTVGRDYHVGARASSVVLIEAAGGRDDRDAVLQVVDPASGQPVKCPSEEALRIEEYVFVPRELTGRLADPAAFKAAVDSARHAIARAHGILSEAFDDEYRIDRTFSKQSERVHVNLRSGFNALRHRGWLPITTGNARFNHLSIVLLMELCFPVRSDLVQFLRNPEFEDPVEKGFDMYNSRRLELLGKLDREGLLPQKELDELDDLRDKLRVPDVQTELLRALDEVSTFQDVVAADLDRSREKLDRMYKSRESRLAKSTAKS